MILHHILLEVAVADIFGDVIIVEKPYACNEKQHDGIHPIEIEFHAGALSFRLVFIIERCSH